MSKYIFDAGVFIILNNHYPKDIFISLWDNMDNVIHEGKVISVSEVFLELSKRDSEAHQYAKKHKQIFSRATIREQELSREIIDNYPDLIGKALYSGEPVADPLIIARAEYIEGTVVTTEKFKPNAFKIPNICQKREVQCLDLFSFMKKEGWKF